jgi:hypothetical protein
MTLAANAAAVAEYQAWLGDPMAGVAATRAAPSGDAPGRSPAVAMGLGAPLLSRQHVVTVLFQPTAIAWHAGFRHSSSRCGVTSCAGGCVLHVLVVAMISCDDSGHRDAGYVPVLCSHSCARGAQAPACRQARERVESAA